MNAVGNLEIVAWGGAEVRGCDGVDGKAAVACRADEEVVRTLEASREGFLPGGSSIWIHTARARGRVYTFGRGVN